MQTNSKRRGRPFQRGFDARRKVFTPQEQSANGRAGFQAMLVSVITRYPHAVSRDGHRHMACNALPAILRKKGGRA